MVDSQLHHSQQTKRIADDCSVSFLVDRRARNEPCCFLFGRLGYGIVYLLLINRARELYWENIARGLHEVRTRKTEGGILPFRSRASESK